MRTHWFRVFPVFSIFFLLLFSLDAVAQLAPNPLITGPVDESQLVTLRGNTHPLAQPQFDVGTAPPDMPLNRMLLVLKRSPGQDYSLKKLLDDQQDKNSPNYRKWLTPDQFGQQFGSTDQDLQIVTGWLEAHGFQVSRVTHGRSAIEFTGVESQLESAFHTQIHQYLVNGQTHWANNTDPQIPAALAPAVAGLSSLHNFAKRPMSVYGGSYMRDKSTGKVTAVNPQFTFPNQYCSQANDCFALGPYDFATIYNVLPLWNAGFDGTGQTIAIVGETDINPQDIADFRAMFGLPANSASTGNPLNIITDGPDPGVNGDESEADIDVEWSGAVAPKAAIDFVVSESTETTQGIDLSALYIIDNNLAPVMSESYGQCELGLGTAGNQFYSALWEQAAAQGITVFVAAGDQGSATCDSFQGYTPQPAQYGLAVSGIASTPFNVAVGGTDFNDFQNPLTYWNTANASTTQASAKSYIPETTWNDSCTNALWAQVGYTTNAETNCNTYNLAGAVVTLGGGGGVSNCTVNQQALGTCSGGYPKPSWQTGSGVPNDSHRDIPDVSLFASNGFVGSFYVVCQSDATYGTCNLNSPYSYFEGFGGTSVSSPAFAGLLALVNQKTGQRQGNANYVFYKLAAQQSTMNCNSSSPASTCIFNDVTTGTIAMPCATGSVNCTTSKAGDQFGILSGYSAATGYDLATGLGSVNANNLINQWNSISFRPTTTTLTLSPTSNLTHGQSVTVTASVAPSSGSGTPTGDISLLTSTGVAAGGFTLNNGAISGSTNLLPGGSYTVSAHYAGDPTFGGSDSNAVNITIGKENSSSQIDLVTFSWNGYLLSSNASTAVYGSPYLLRVNVLNSQGVTCQSSPGQLACPTGNVTLTDNGNPLDAGTYALNIEGYAEDQTVELPAGTNSVKAQYAGDASFNTSSTSAAYAITPALTTITPPTLPCCFVGSQYDPVVTVQAQSYGVVPTGTVTFHVNGNLISGNAYYSGNSSSNFPPQVYYQASFYSSNSPFPSPGTYNITATYSGDNNYQPATSAVTTAYIGFAPPNLSLQPPSSSVSPGTAVTLTATVSGASTTIAPTGTVSFAAYEGSVPGSVTYATVTNSSTGNLDLQAKITVNPNFSDFYGAQYSGDVNFPAVATSGFVASIAVTGSDFSLLPLPPNTLTLSPGNSGTVELLVGVQASTAPVSFSATACSGLPKETTCTVSPTPDSATGAVNVQILTTAPHAVASIRSYGVPIRPWWPVGFAPLAAMLLCSRPRRRTWRNIVLAVIGVIFALLLGCGGGSSNGGGSGGGGGGGNDPGTPAGSYAITVTATSGSYTHSATFTLVVQ